MLSKFLTKLVIAAILCGSFSYSYAKPAQKQCTLINGTLIQLPGKPVFKFNSSHKYSNNGYPMTHTQFFIKTGDGQIYKVVVDNLFYKDISLAQVSSLRDVGVTTDFSRNYPLGSNVDACGKIFKNNGNPGIHFVHPSACNSTGFNGFLRINGVEISNNQNYCADCACKVNS